MATASQPSPQAPVQTPVQAPAQAPAQPQGNTQVQTRKEESTQQLPPYNVVLLNDDDHSYEYVIEMGVKLFNLSLAKAFEAALTVDKSGRAVMCTTHKEHAELKREQVHSFGRDRLIAGCAGSMSAVIEPAQVT